jgi:hypothetical protein
LTRPKGRKNTKRLQFKAKKVKPASKAKKMKQGSKAKKRPCKKMKIKKKLFSNHFCNYLLILRTSQYITLV